MSNGEGERQVISSAESAQRLKVCRCGRVCGDYPRCRHTDWPKETPPKTPTGAARNKDR